jgi:hypothetical protein
MHLADAEKTLIFKCIAGSHAYGLNRPDSDIDTRGVFTVDPLQYWSMNSPPEQVSDSTNDTTYYSLHRCLHLLALNNPNMLELLWMSDDCILHTSDMWQEVIKIRDAFIAKRALDTFAGYAVAQIKKARGQNKLINNPVPEEKPVKEDFCWVIPCPIEQYVIDGSAVDGNGLPYGYLCCQTVKPFDEEAYIRFKNDVLVSGSPFRPKKISEIADPDFTLKHFHCAALEHVKNVYRLYYFGDNAKGIFRGDDNLCMESIPVDNEFHNFWGLLIYNKDAYESALKKWTQYWGWRKNRNEARWVDQENKKVDFDAKNLCHCMRLIYSGKHIVTQGIPLVRLAGTALQRCKDIRAGLIPYDEIVAEAEEGVAWLDNQRKNCSLPSTPDFGRINELSIRIHKELMK